MNFWKEIFEMINSSKKYQLFLSPETRGPDAELHFPTREIFVTWDLADEWDHKYWIGICSKMAEKMKFPYKQKNRSKGMLNYNQSHANNQC